MAGLIQWWILASAACVAAGWILSAFHALGASGYLASGLLLGLGFGVWSWPRRSRIAAAANRSSWRRYVRRFRRPLPLIFLTTAVLAAIGGALYAPNNYDALTYRLPRMLHWWSASGWHWITTADPRMNNRSVDFEWLTMPLLVFTHGDRSFFLLNVIGYLLMPGLLFSVFVGAGVAARVAWHWMWLLPMGYCYVMQAGSIGNDTIAVTYVLASLHFSWRARRMRRETDVWLALLAAGLATGVKGTNLPLLLPLAWGILAAACRIRMRLVCLGGVLILAMLISFLPTAVANHLYCGQWNGLSQDSGMKLMLIRNPLVGVLGNSVQLIVQTASPPVLPHERDLETWMWSQPVPSRLLALVHADFGHFAFGLGELPQEESSGLGLGIGCAILGSLFYSLRRRSRGSLRTPGFVTGALSWVSLIFFMTQLGTEAPGRLVSAYYPLLLLPLLVFPANRELIRRRGWRALTMLAGLYAVTALVLTPSRPLWPAERCLDFLAAKFPADTQLARAAEVYHVYRQRSQLLRPLLAHIPPSVSTVGLIEGGDDTETSLWYPYGTRKVVHIVDAERNRRPDMEWVVVKDNMVAGGSAGLEDWLRQTGGTLVADEIITSKVAAGPEKWSVVRFAPASAGSSAQEP